MGTEGGKDNPPIDETDPIRVAIFDDAKEAIEEYERLFEKENVDLWTYQGSRLADVRESLRGFTPELIIVDLLIGNDRHDGYRLIRDIWKAREFRGAPVVVCSKLINKAERGERERLFCLNQRGVKDALPKVSAMPEANEFLQWARKGEGT